MCGSRWKGCYSWAVLKVFLPSPCSCRLSNTCWPFMKLNLLVLRRYKWWQQAACVSSVSCTQCLQHVSYDATMSGQIKIEATWQRCLCLHRKLGGGKTGGLFTPHCSAQLCIFKTAFDLDARASLLLFWCCWIRKGQTANSYCIIPF